MIPRTTTIIVVLALSAMAWGQAETSEYQVGTLTGQNVYVRSEPDSYPCGKISAPSTVQVVSRQGDWYKIVPPPGVFSVISRQYVELAADGQTGTVTGNVVLVRAGAERDLGSLDRYYVDQVRLNTGDKVWVVGEGVDFYKITPPSGAYVWISTQYVRTESEPADVVDSSDGVVADMSAPEMDAVEAEVLTDAGREFMRLDRLLAAELAKPIGQQDLRSLQEQYRAINASGAALRSAIERRMMYVDSAIKLQQDALEVERMAAESQARREEFQRRMQQASEGAGPETQAPSYDAWGLLSMSGLYVDSAVKRYLLTDPETRSMNAYARSTDAVDLSKYVGSLIGVRGRAVYEPASGLNVIDVTSVELLASVAPTPAPIRPPAPVAPAPPEPAPSAPVEPAQPPTPLEAPAVPMEPEPLDREPAPMRPLPVPPEPILVEPDRPMEPLPSPSPEAELPVQPEEASPPMPPAVEENLPEPPAEPERPSVLIHPEPEEEDPTAIPERPTRPPRPGSEPSSPPRAEEDTGPPRPVPPVDIEPPTPARPGEQPEGPAEEEEPEEPAKPPVVIRRPLPPSGLPIEEPPAEGPPINVREYE